MLNKLLTAVQVAAFVYAYGLAGLSDLGVISCRELIVKLVATVIIIATLQKMKEPVSHKRSGQAQ